MGLTPSFALQRTGEPAGSGFGRDRRARLASNGPRPLPIPTLFGRSTAAGEGLLAQFSRRVAVDAKASAS